MTDHVEPVRAAIAMINEALSRYVFKATTEALLQDQVATVLASLSPAAWFEREVIVHGGRLDILVHIGRVNVVLELKLHAATASVERQAQRYAMMQDIDAVGVVTTSRRLTHGVGDAAELGGKPFFVIALRTT